MVSLGDGSGVAAFHRSCVVVGGNGEVEGGVGGIGEVLVAVLDVDLEGSGCGVGSVVLEGDQSVGELSACEGGSGAAVDEDSAVVQ